MDKNAIKKYAVWARNELIERIRQKALRYGIMEKNSLPKNTESINGVVLTDTEKQQRQALMTKIEQQGFKQTMEEIAYTWFNRFIAIRFMEVNGYLPTHTRVFSDESNAFKPQILAEAINIELKGLDKEIVYKLKENNQEEELFRYLLIVQCNALNEILPVMFQKLEDYTELLLPDNLLREGSVIEKLVLDIPEEDWLDAVQIIGWLYQYYNTEPKDQVFANLKKNIKISKENIPAATQLFTPDWIVRYMVENSLGRLWVEGHPNDKEQLLPTETEQQAFIADHSLEDGKWHYYLEEAKQEPEVQAELAKIREEYAQLKPEDIKFIDPCQGSGHIICYGFDVFMKIYQAYGYNTRDAVASIVKNNIWGLDIDERASQLAYFAIMMKARKYDRRFFTRGIQPHVYEIVESNNVDKDTLKYFCNGDAELTKAMNAIVTELHDAKEYGSIITVTPQNWDKLHARFAEIADSADLYRDAALQLLPMVNVAEALGQKYHSVVTNPPYMGASNMNAALSKFIKENYSDYKSDFFSAFVIHASQMAKRNGYCGFLTPYVWMFIQSYEDMRNYLYQHATIETLIQFEYSAFEEATVPICTFAFRNGHTAKRGCYLRLTEFRGGMGVQRKKALEAISNHKCGFYFEKRTDDFEKVPGNPVAYWVGEAVYNIFETNNIGTHFDVKAGICTGKNEKYIFQWYEIDNSTFSINTDKFRFTPHNKGGEYRKWYGNRDYVLKYNVQSLAEMEHNAGFRHDGKEYYFRRHIGWSKITSSKSSFRLFENGFTFDSAGLGLFSNNANFYSTLALLNSKVVEHLLSVLNPTLNVTPIIVKKLPYKDIDVKKHVENNIRISKEDWDSFETSWDFTTNPLIRLKPAKLEPMPVVNTCGDGGLLCTLEQAYDAWDEECNDRFNQLKANEEELNRIFIDIYGLQDELSPEVEDKDVTVRKADLQRDIRSLISYAVGCMFGRYSLKTPGLAYAGGEWNKDKEYLAEKYGEFAVDPDNIIPICDDEYFEDDIVSRFVEFIKLVYGAETLEENLQFIADALGGKGSSRDVIRSYFVNDFYADHCKIYQKRPIYWLFDSGKKNGFKCLIYMHRYARDTMARVRTDYVHEQQARYRIIMEDLEKRITEASGSERVKLSKKLAAFQAKDVELRAYEEKVHYFADRMLSIDLDDGVKHNYAIFQDVLAKIK